MSWCDSMTNNRQTETSEYSFPEVNNPPLQKELQNVSALLRKPLSSHLLFVPGVSQEAAQLGGVLRVPMFLSCTSPRLRKARMSMTRCLNYVFLTSFLTCALNEISDDWVKLIMLLLSYQIILLCMFMHKCIHLFNKYLLRNYCVQGSGDVQQLRLAWPLPLWSSNLGLPYRCCEERRFFILKNIYDFLSFIIWDVLLKESYYGSETNCFSLVHLVELVLKVKSQLLICQIFLENV